MPMRRRKGEGTSARNSDRDARGRSIRAGGARGARGSSIRFPSPPFPNNAGCASHKLGNTRTRRCVSDPNGGQDSVGEDAVRDDGGDDGGALDDAVRDSGGDDVGEDAVRDDGGDDAALGAQAAGQRAAIPGRCCFPTIRRRTCKHNYCSSVC